MISVGMYVSMYLRMLLNGIEEREGHMVGVEWTSRSGWMDDGDGKDRLECVQRVDQDREFRSC